MRIVCPACDATYDVPDAMLGGPTRKVRCAKCGNEWVPTAASARPHSDLEFEAPPPPEPFAALPVPDVDPHGRHEPRLKPLRPRPEPRYAEPPVDIPQAPPPARGGGGWAVLAWVLTLLVLAAAAGAAVVWHSQVVAAWPPSERLYSAVGLR